MQHPSVQHRRQPAEAGAPQHKCQHHKPRHRGRKPEQDDAQDECDQRNRERHSRKTVTENSGEDEADRSGKTVSQKQGGDGIRAERSHIDEPWRDVGVQQVVPGDHQHHGDADHRDAHDGGVTTGGQTDLAGREIFKVLDRGQEEDNEHREEDDDPGHHQESGTPAEGVTECHPDRHSDDERQRATRGGHRNRPRQHVFRHEVCSVGPGHRPKQSVGQTAGDAREQKEFIGWGDPGKNVRQREGRQENDDKPFAREPASDYSQRRRGEHNRNRKGRHQEADSGLRNLQIFGHIGQKPHRQKLARDGDEDCSAENEEGK